MFGCRLWVGRTKTLGCQFKRYLGVSLTRRVSIFGGQFKPAGEIFGCQFKPAGEDIWVSV